MEVSMFYSLCMQSYSEQDIIDLSHLEIKDDLK